MAHEVVYGFCENKCKVEVAPKTVVDDHEERVTALEAGEFETVNCAGTIVADELCGNRVGEITTTSPTKWSVAVSPTEILSYTQYSNSASGSSTYTPDSSLLYQWDKIYTNDATASYTVKIIGGISSQLYINKLVITFTDYITGNTVTKTYNLTYNSYSSYDINNRIATYIINDVPAFATVNVTSTVNQAMGSVAFSISITRNTKLYIKPKGT